MRCRSFACSANGAETGTLRRIVGRSLFHAVSDADNPAPIVVDVHNGETDCTDVPSCLSRLGQECLFVGGRDGQGENDCAVDSFERSLGDTGVRIESVGLAGGRYRQQ